MIKIASLAIAAALAGTATVFAAEKPDSLVCEFECVVENRPDTKKIYIYEDGGDIRVCDRIELPVVDGRVATTLKTYLPRCYTFVFDDEMREGAFLNRQFFVENSHVTYHAFSYDEMCDYVEGDGPIQIEQNKLDSIVDSNNAAEKDSLSRRRLEMEADGTCTAEPLRDIYRQMRDCTDPAKTDSLRALAGPIVESLGGDSSSPEYRALIDRQVVLWQNDDSVRRSYIRSHPSLVGLCEIKRQLPNYKWALGDVEDYNRIFKERYESLSWHPYYAETQTISGGLDVLPGKPYPDFTITGVDGSKATVGKLIEGRPAVIDLWASWCGPCRRHSKELVPVYEKYRDKGFVVVAVAREHGNTDAMLRAIEKDGYPWQSYVDLNDADGVWAINGASHAGGKVILVGPDGKIVAVMPEAEQVEEYLSRFYGEK